ncbi:MAG: hypothetical protein WEB79_00210, partial [Thermoleophilaceae bacterium]
MQFIYGGPAGNGPDSSPPRTPPPSSGPYVSSGSGITIGPSGQIIVAAIKKDGTLYTRTGAIGSGWNGFYRQGKAGSWSTAAVTIGSDGRYRLLATKKSGDLY